MTAPLNETALRALVRDVIVRIESRSGDQPEPGALNRQAHPSHYQYTLPPSDGPCFIEPGVRCNHCGYCETHGH